MLEIVKKKILDSFKRPFQEFKVQVTECNHQNNKAIIVCD